MVGRGHASLGLLAGGRGRRLGGADKAFLRIGDQTLLERALAAAGEGFAVRLASHNRPRAPQRSVFEAQGLRFVADELAAGEGPLAGLHALLQAVATDWMLSLPVDLARPGCVPFEALLATRGACLRDADGPQPLVALWPVAAAREAVASALQRGERSVQAVAATLGLATMDITPLRLGNLNTPRDFEDIG